MRSLALRTLLVSLVSATTCSADTSPSTQRTQSQSFAPRRRIPVSTSPPILDASQRAMGRSSTGNGVDSFVDDDFSDSGAADGMSSILSSPPDTNDMTDMDGRDIFDFDMNYDDNEDAAYAARGGDDEGSDGDDDEEYGEGSEKGALYDAYNLLHTLAQDFQKPFDAPAVVVVGHQSSGKSALIEALMGFQFNQVGGGTKTRRPVALRMQYNPKCSHPKCFLQGEDGIERPKTLSEIQDYIQRENMRLEKDPLRCFDSREINVRMEYKYCPNMILIDTPGLISAPRIPKGRNGAGAASVQQRALLASAREAERLVVSKMRVPDYIILCVEDTSDWKHGATREIVQKADPDLSRTVIVNTKLDTKVPQFGTPGDVADFLHASIINKLSPHKLGGPFFTSVPSGRVGRPSDFTGVNMDDFIYDNDEDFVAACGDNEDSDRSVVWQRIKKFNGKDKRGGTITFDPKGLMPRVGLSRLRGFLERRVDECYRRNVAKIVPLLQAEHVAAERRLEACESELEALSVDRLKAGADAFCDDFCKAIKESIQGTVLAPASLFGETLEQEYVIAGSFHDVQGCPMAVSDRTWHRLVVTEVGNRDHRLYGGSQYHRVLREFNLATRCLRLPTITEDEIANAAGIGDVHDGVNFLRAACVIALEKAQISFDPLLEALKSRVTHVMSRLCPVGEHMIRQRQERKLSSFGYSFEERINSHDNSGGDSATDVTQNPQFQQLIQTIFEQFVQKCSDSAMARCRDDLTALTRFVTWDLHERGGGALRRSLPDQTDIVSVYQVAVKAAKKGQKQSDGANEAGNKGTITDPTKNSLTRIPEPSQNDDRDYLNLLQLMEEAACSRDANRTNLVVGGLVQHIVSQWRETFGRSVTTKFNCYFLLPFTDEFSRYLRGELQKVYEGENLCEAFDLLSARRELLKRREELMSECTANKRLQEKFDAVAKMMRGQQADEMLKSKSSGGMAGSDHR